MAGFVKLSDMFTIDAGSNLSGFLSTNTDILSNRYHISVPLSREDITYQYVMS